MQSGRGPLARGQCGEERSGAGNTHPAGRGCARLNPPPPFGFGVVFFAGFLFFFLEGGRLIFGGVYFHFFFGVWLETWLTHPYFLKEEAVRNT